MSYGKACRGTVGCSVQHNVPVARHETNTTTGEPGWGSWGNGTVNVAMHNASTRSPSACQVTVRCRNTPTMYNVTPATPMCVNVTVRQRSTIMEGVGNDVKQLGGWVIATGQSTGNNGYRSVGVGSHVGSCVCNTVGQGVCGRGQIATCAKRNA